MKNILDKGIGSLKVISALQILKSFYKEDQNIRMITKYNSFSVHKWIFTTPIFMSYKKLDFS